MAHLLSRRTLLGSCSSALALGEDRTACCATPEAPPDSFRVEGGYILVDIRKVPSLGRKGGAAKIVDIDRNVNIIVVEPEKGRFAALERSCTHGGAQVVYNGINKTVQCTSWGHSEFALDGRLLGGSAKKPLPTHEARVEGTTVRIKLESKA